MNEKFLELPEEKRLRIINAGFEVFAKSEYKKASTDDIAAKAGISKGLLFYYFHDKKSLYLYLYDTAAQIMTESVLGTEFETITDVFEMFEFAAGQKYAIIQKSPYIMEFFMRGLYAQQEPFTEALNKRFENQTAEIYAMMFKNLDYSKFREDASPTQLMQMLSWMADGYLHERQRYGKTIDLDDLMAQYRIWSDIFKRIAYKEEYQQ
jgi:AcrR family transcriptional regulator